MLILDNNGTYMVNLDRVETIYVDKRANKWVIRVGFPDGGSDLGMYDSEEEAKKTYNELVGMIARERTVLKVED